MAFSKHEIISCERCDAGMECKSNANNRCQCNQIVLSLNEVQYISENYEGCLCLKCLQELQKEYQERG